jgi:hypothetical protein
MIDLKQYSMNVSEPVFSISTLDDSSLCDTLWRLEAATDRQLVVRICRGSKMRSVNGLFCEFAAAFQFPYYFGENWTAFDECLCDLDWLPAKAYLVCITSADQLLADDISKSYEVLINVLGDIADGWAGGNPNLQLVGRSATPFHVLMQVSKDSEQALSDKLASLGAAVTRIS